MERTDLAQEQDNREKRIDAAYEAYVREHNDNVVRTDLRTLGGVLAGSLLIAVNINLFVNNAGLLPGGFSGVAILLQRIFQRFFGLSIPFSPLSLAFNAVPAYFAFRIIGKRYPLFSCLYIVIMSFLTDLIPAFSITEDRLLMAVFGGIVNGAGCSLILNLGACTGGTDFIAMCLSVKKGITVFNYIMAANWVLLLISGSLFGMESALYSIIFQYVGTQVVNLLYQRFEKKTLFVITERPDDIITELRTETNHTCTVLHGEGGYLGDEKRVLYMVIGADELGQVRRLIRAIDKNAFINIMNSEMVTGNFYIRPYQ